MATVQLTSTDRNSVNGAILFQWDLGNADSGSSFNVPFSAEITAQITGTFGSATVVVEGSNDGTNWTTLTKKGGTSAASFTSAGLCTVNENPAYIRASTSGGTGSAIKVVVALHARYSKVNY